MKKTLIVTVMVAGALSLFAETDEIGKAGCLNDGSGKNYKKCRDSK